MSRRVPAVLIPLCAVVLMIPAVQRRPPTRFATPQEALAYAAARLKAVAPDVDLGDAYASTLFRAKTGLDGQRRLYVLVGTAAEELALGEGFLMHGFDREARAHLQNLVHYHPTASEAARARDLLPRCRVPSVLDLVPERAAVLEDARGERFVAGKAGRPEPPSDARPQAAYLEPATPVPPVKVVGYVDAGGRIEAGGGIDGDGTYYR
ncbi:MAG TPA: hypothetical protein VEJ18_07670, partial [Planctomycetota bacterium]|nr:hypothetical protein [Planctomycetota bacterium]